MLVSMHSDPRLATLLFFLSYFIPNALALGVQFTNPAGGSTWPAGSMTVRWTDGGGSPNMADLTTYTLDLLVGGNSPENSKVVKSIVAPHSAIADGQVDGDIPAAAAQSIQNGFYFRMTSNTSAGNEVLNYSERFTLIDMNGTTANQYLEAANAAAGSITNVPEAQYNVIMAGSSSTQTASQTSIAATSQSTGLNPSASAPVSGDGDAGGMSSLTLGLVVMGSILAFIGAVSIIIWILFFYRRARRKREEGNTKDTIEDPLFLSNKTELAAYRSSRVVTTPRTPIEMNAERDRQELSGLDKPTEAPASPMIYELEGDLSIWEAGSGRRSKAWEAV